jgi:hypothetical protein
MAAAPGSAETLAIATCPGGAPVLQLANPGPGDVLLQGDYIVSGVAFDPSATQGNGISRVDLFLGQRDSGGLFLAAATPGQDATNPRVFQTKVTLPDSVSGGRDFIAYAYSSVNGQQTSESVPVYVGTAPTPTPIPSGGSAPAPRVLTTSTQSTCHADAAVQSAAPAQGAAPAQSSAASAVQTAPTLQLGNPNPGDVLPNGDLIVEGIAFDASATDGSGIDSVDLFLDSRDSGGQPLGSGVPGSGNRFQIKATLPANANGGHNFVAYARSSVSGQESMQSVPVYVGAAPTPTPRPK